MKFRIDVQIQSNVIESGYKMPATKNDYLRHTIATIAYRFQKSVSVAGKNFADFSLGQGSRSSTEIVHHIYHVLWWTRIFVQEKRFIKEKPEKLSFNLEIERVNREFEMLDNLFSETALDMNFSKRLLQGPLSDVLTHIGQLSMLSRLNGHPVKGEDFSSAAISTGVVRYFSQDDDQ